jgi:GT2 family glycosyltransferase
VSDSPSPDRVTAVVVNFDGEAYLEDCLDSLIVQDVVDEVLVVDDCSTDDSVALVRERYPDVEVVVLPENRGPGAARNEGLRRARNRWVLCVDNDAIPEPGVAERLLAVVTSRPGCVAAQPRSVIHDEPDRVHYDAGDFHYVGLLALRNFYAPLAEAEGEGIVPTRALITICPLVDRDALLACGGGYDEDYFYLAEDFDMALRLSIAGHEIVAVEDAIVRHQGGTEGLSFRGGGYPRRRAFLHSRNRWLLIGKCYAARTLFVALPGILVYELVWLLFTLGQGHLGAHLRGKLEFLRMLRGLGAKRREVQASRRVRDRDLLVGGPLTFSPSLVARGPARLAAGLLDGVLRGWWAIARWLSA